MSEPQKPSPNEKSYILDLHKAVLEQQSVESPSDSGNGHDTQQLFQEEKPNKTTGLEFASFNYINSILGSGVIGIPYALKQAGFGFGLLLLGFIALVTDYSLILMVRSAHISSSFSYQGLMQAAFGNPGFYLLTFLQFTYPFIAMVSYNVVVGDTVTKVLIRIFNLKPWSLLARRDFVVFLATVFITIPLCLFRDMAKLARASLISLFFVVFILVAIIIRLFTFSHRVTPFHGINSWQAFNWGIIPAIGIMAFAFMCHHNVFLLYSSIEAADQTRWDKVTHYSVFTSFIVSVLFGVTGYATFNSFVQGDLLENYCWDDDLMNAARIAFSATILLTYPIECMVTRAVIDQIVNIADSSVRHYAVTLTIISITYILSVATDCLGVVLELNGVLSAVPLAFILPAASYLKLEEGSVFCKRKLPAFGLALFGITVAVVGLFHIVIRFSSDDRCSHGRIMPYCIQNTTFPF
ncbi:putative sodium-coupled neutral amino acid transporter 11 [Lycorma delicatula]|uniref:putative sodium-coupled neutral amino acid transporter 11 n=1 Tax=Lycorma delicatula TaxID=130591 RepID=UPI003F512506